MIDLAQVSTEDVSVAAAMLSPVGLAVRHTRGRADPWRPSAHHYLISKYLRAAACGEIDRLIICQPPQTGKSDLVSRYFPAWYVGRNPSRTVIVVGYGEQFAWKEYGLKSLRIMEDTVCPLFGTRLDRRNISGYLWRTEDGGGVRSAGIGGSITGFRGDMLVLDDPYPSWREAQSAHYRDVVWQYYTSTLVTRLHPHAAQIIAMTRWHENDIVGHLLEREPDRWTVLRFPAIAEENDLLGRQPGEPLWPEARSVEFWDEARKRTTEYYWRGMYQQDPMPPEGHIIDLNQRGWFREITVDGQRVFELESATGETSRVPADLCFCFQTVDTAMKTGTHNDYTAVATVYVTPDSKILIHRIWRAQIDVPRQYAAIRSERARYNGDVSFQAVEEAASGIGLIQQARRDGCPFRTLKAKGDKLQRADSLMLAYENGMVYHLRGAPWVREFETELTFFPNGSHDDQVDVAAYAAMLVAQGVGRMPKIEVL